MSKKKGTDWKIDLYEYLMMYHSTPLETTGCTPAKLMLNRELNNFLPKITDSKPLSLEGPAERDIMLKTRKGAHENEKRRAKENDLEVGDTVLMKNIHKGALQPNFNAEEMKVVKVTSSEVAVRSDDTEDDYQRNRTYLKRLHLKETDRQNETNEPQFRQREEEEEGREREITKPEEKEQRSQRATKVPTSNSIQGF